jgi:tetraacyldisaccharide 4'-kinase
MTQTSAKPLWAARPWLAPLVPLYGLGLLAREFALRTGLEPVRKLRWPVISIGNLSTGGAGKTPLTIALAQALTRRGHRIDVLSRGYGRSGRATARVDPNGTAEDFGDEPLLIARDAGVPVYVAAQRYEAGLLAERDAPSGPGLHLLDDGFQHRQLHRDVNILVLDSHDWFGDRLLPAGNLREPLGAKRRAHVLAIPAEEAASLEDSLRGKGQWHGPIWRLRRKMDTPQIEGRVVAFCGIAKSEQFFEGLHRGGLRLAHCLVFPDHHRYTTGDLERLLETARKADAAALVTTAKDRVRLGAQATMFPETLPLRTAGLRMEIEDEDAVLAPIQALRSSHSAETS